MANDFDGMGRSVPTRQETDLAQLVERFQHLKRVIQSTKAAAVKYDADHDLAEVVAAAAAAGEEAKWRNWWAKLQALTTDVPDLP